MPPLFPWSPVFSASERLLALIRHRLALDIGVLNMPIYEYVCESCGHELEALQKLSDPLLTDCPQCESQSLKKKISAAAFRLKGGGWYETDFKSGKKKNLAGDDKPAASDKKSESKKSDASGSKSGGGSAGAKSAS